MIDLMFFGAGMFVGYLVLWLFDKCKGRGSQ